MPKSNFNKKKDNLLQFFDISLLHLQKSPVNWYAYLILCCIDS